MPLNVVFIGISELLCITFMEQYERFKYLANRQSTVMFMENVAVNGPEREVWLYVLKFEDNWSV